MNEHLQPVQLLLILAAGAGVGLLYFGSLWLVVRRLTTSTTGQLLLPFTYLLRTVLAVLAIYLLTGGEWPLVLACMTGFLLSRTLLVHRIGGLDVIPPSRVLRHMEEQAQ